MMSVGKAAACLAGLIVTIGAGGAAATTYTSSAAFTAAVPTLVTEDYGTYAAGTTIADGGTLGDLTYSFNTASGLGGVVTNIYNSFTGLSLGAKQIAGPLSSSDFFYADEGFTVYFPHAVRAVGIFSNTNLPSPSTITTSSGSAFNPGGAYDTSTFVFLGFKSKTPFTSATFSAGEVYNIPSISYGGGVPEPATWGLMILGFAATGAFIRRTRARQATA